MILNVTKSYYSVDLVYKIGEKVCIYNLAMKTSKPIMFTIVDVERPPKDFGLRDQKLTVQCHDTKIIHHLRGDEVIKYDTFLIFWTMAFFNRMLRQHFSSEFDF